MTFVASHALQSDDNGAPAAPTELSVIFAVLAFELGEGGPELTDLVYLSDPDMAQSQFEEKVAEDAYALLLHIPAREDEAITVLRSGNGVPDALLAIDRPTLGALIGGD